jgi:hypothetical protein
MRHARAAGLFAMAVLSVSAVGCGPPPEDELVPENEGEGEGEDPGEVGEGEEPGEVGEGEVFEAPGGPYLSIQCQGKHSRHEVRSTTHRGGRFTKAGNTETFEHLNKTCNRVEVDTNDHYKTGTHTFSGDVRIGKVSGQSIVQIFNAPASGPIMMIKAYGADGGTLRKQGGSVTLIRGISNEWVNVRTVHNLGANSLTIFINGDRAWSGSGGRGGSFNLKYGNYGTGAPTKVQWRNVRF